MRDKDYNLPAGRTYANMLRKTFGSVGQVPTTVQVPTEEAPGSLFPELDEPERVDVIASLEDEMVRCLEADSRLMDRIDSPDGAAWGSIKALFLVHLPQELDDREQFAFRLVPKVLSRLFG